ncbi:MAG TPA: hypothetical protein VGC39_11010 [Candidatus Methylacidiphilales bacterium]
MTLIPPAERQEAIRKALSKGDDPWQRRLTRSGYLVGAALFHLVLFLMLATMVVFRAPVVPSDNASFQAVKIAPPPPPAPPAPSGGEAANNFEPSVDVAPPPSALAVISTAHATDFAIKAPKMSVPNLPPSLTQPAGTALAGHSAQGPTSGAGTPFGTSSGNGTTQLEGFLYDLKQTADRQPTNLDPGGYHDKIRQFVADNWNPNVLRPYYKSSAPLHTSSIFIPVIDADDGPKAFGVQAEVQPRLYCVWYKVTASPPQDGTYHFVGVGDDILVVRVNHRTVLDGCDFPVTDELRQKETKLAMTNFDPTFELNGNFWVGTPFHVSAHEPVDIEVLIGEEPGGKSDYFLYIEREESTYQKQANGTPLLPPFQLDSNPIKPCGPPRSFPPFACAPEPWEAAMP